MLRALVLTLLSTAAVTAAAEDVKPMLCQRDVRQGGLKCRTATVEQATGVVYCPGGGPISPQPQADARGVGGSNPTAIEDEGTPRGGPGGSRPTAIDDDNTLRSTSVSWSTGTTAPALDGTDENALSPCVWLTQPRW